MFCEEVGTGTDFEDFANDPNGLVFKEFLNVDTLK